jgi:ABC-type multidrug transport system fused ATPase/permease subunit
VTAVQESLELAKIILGFGNKDKSYNELKSAFEAHTQATVKSQTLTNAIPELYQPFGVIVLIVALLAAGKFSISLSAMAVLLLALLRVVFSIGSLISYRHSLENFFPSYEQIDDFRNKAKELKQYSGNRVFIGFKREIAIEDVTFAYLGHNPALIKVNMKIPKGKMIAVVGESGAGKSTLIDIIMGFNEPMKGRVLFDGVDLREFDINSYRRRIGYVPQDSILFNMSIRDNLLWSKEDATSQDIKYSCRLASADEFIERLPNAYDTLVGDRGVRLSGGQRQRIALARAILRQPELLFLDEATSSLDTQSEKLIQQAIENIVRETTIIVIAHRLSTIVNADYVYVLKEGGVIEEGTYLDLVKRDCHFNRMVKLQLLKVA